MMNSAWNLSGDAPTYQKQQKAWAMEDKRPQTSSSAYQRKNGEPNGQPTIRSGMVSSDFALGDG